MDFPADIRDKLQNLKSVQLEDVVTHCSLDKVVILADSKLSDQYREFRNQWQMAYGLENELMLNWLNCTIHAVVTRSDAPPRPQVSLQLFSQFAKLKEGNASSMHPEEAKATTDQLPSVVFCHSKLDGITMQISHLLTEMGEIKTTLNARPCITK